MRRWLLVLRRALRESAVCYDAIRCVGGRNGRNGLDSGQTIS